MARPCPRGRPSGPSAHLRQSRSRRAARSSRPAGPSRPPWPAFASTSARSPVREHEREAVEVERRLGLAQEAAERLAGSSVEESARAQRFTASSWSARRPIWSRSCSASRARTRDGALAAKLVDEPPHHEPHDQLEAEREGHVVDVEAPSREPVASATTRRRPRPEAGRAGPPDRRRARTAAPPRSAGDTRSWRIGEPSSKEYTKMKAATTAMSKASDVAPSRCLPASERGTRARKRKTPAPTARTAVAAQAQAS